MEERLQKYLAECGIASRRKCEEYILQGKVEINNNIVTPNASQFLTIDIRFFFLILDIPFYIIF